MERGDWWAKVRGVAESDMTEQLTHYGPNVLDSYQCCSLQHWTLLLPPVTSTAGWCFCFGSVSSFFLELFLHWSPVAYWAPSDLGSSSFSVLSFCLFILFMGFSRKEYWSGLWFPSPVDHILSELSAMTCLGWPYTAWFIVSLIQTRLWSMWSDWLVFCDCGFQSVCPLAEKDKRKLMEASWWERLTEGETGSCSDGQGHDQ